MRNILSPVTKDGKMLNLPPIHTHHTHVIPQRGIRPRMMERPMCIGTAGLNIPFLDNLVKEKECYNFSQPFEQHGDYNCLPKDDGMDCLVLGDELPIRINQAYDIEGELNDVRPKGSEPMLWYYQLAFRWKPADLSKPPVSGLVMIGPGALDPSNQLTKSYTAPVVPKEESIYMYSANLLRSGELIRAKIHSHSSLMQASMMFAGTYEDLGLGDDKFRPKGRSYTQIYAKDIGFPTNADFVEYVFENLKKSQERWDLRCLGQATIKDAICTRRRPELKCGGIFNQGFAEYQGKTYGFDRRPIANCKEWNFVKGEPFVVVGLNKKVDYPYSWNDPNHAPKVMAQHHGFFFYYRDRSRTNSEMEGHLTATLGTFHSFGTPISPTKLLAIVTCLVLFAGPPVYGSTIDMIQWFYFFALLGLWTLVLWLVVKVGHMLRLKLEEMQQDKKLVYQVKYQPVQVYDDEDERAFQEEL